MAWLILFVAGLLEVGSQQLADGGVFHAQDVTEIAEATGPGKRPQFLIASRL